MDKEKEIEEMAYSILFYCEDEECDKCKYRDKINCRCFKIAETLINEGYGNKKQAVKEFAEKLKDKLIEHKEILQCEAEECKKGHFMTAFSNKESCIREVEILLTIIDGVSEEQ